MRALLGCSRAVRMASQRRVTGLTSSRFFSAAFATATNAEAAGSSEEFTKQEKQLPVGAASSSSSTSSSISSSPNALASSEAAAEKPLEHFKGLDTLIIGDILSLRETEFTKEMAKRASHFDEWKSVSATQTVHDAIAIMVKSNVGSLIVSEDNHGIVGILTERDVLKKTSPRSILRDKIFVKDIMSSHIMCIHPSTTIMDALATMSKENFRHLAVIHGEVTTTVKKGFVPTDLMRCVLSVRDIIQGCVYLEKETNKITDAERPKSVKMAIVAEENKPHEGESSSADVTQKDSESAATTDTSDPSASDASTASSPPVVTASVLLKKKHKHIRLILNTRPEDNVTVAEAVEAMAQNNFGSVLIVDKENCVVGIFTERDYMTRVLDRQLDPTSVRVIDVSTNDVKFLQYEDSLETCWYQVATGIRHFPVAASNGKDKELTGILSVKDIVREISKGHNSSPGFWLMEFFKAKMEAAKEAKKEHDAKKEKQKEQAEAQQQATSESQMETTNATTATTASAAAAPATTEEQLATASEPLQAESSSTVASEGASNTPTSVSDANAKDKN